MKAVDVQSNLNIIPMREGLIKDSVVYCMWAYIGRNFLWGIVREINLGTPYSDNSVWPSLSWQFAPVVEF